MLLVVYWLEISLQLPDVLAQLDNCSIEGESISSQVGSSRAPKMPQGLFLWFSPISIKLTWWCLKCPSSTLKLLKAWSRIFWVLLMNANTYKIFLRVQRVTQHLGYLQLCCHCHHHYQVVSQLPYPDLGCLREIHCLMIGYLVNPKLWEVFTWFMNGTHQAYWEYHPEPYLQACHD